MKPISPIIIITFIAVNIIASSCEDPLPSRESTPVELFKTNFQTADSDTTFYATRDPVNISTPHPPPIVYQLQVINIFDETLRGLAVSINGTIEIWLEEDLSVGKTFLLSQSTEFPPIGIPSHIDSAYITLDPGDTFYVEIEWPHETENGVKMWDYFSLKNGEERDVIINSIAKIQLFPDTPIIITNIFTIKVIYMKIS